MTRLYTKAALFLFLTVFPVQVFSETMSDINARAERYYAEKKFAEAIREWLSALDIDPGNENIQRKIEIVYEEKHRRNIAIQKTKIEMRETSANAEKLSADELQIKTKSAVDDFVIAYRIDPNDSEIKNLRPKVEKFQREMLALIEKKLRSEADVKKYEEAVAIAKALMIQEKYDEALKQWNIALEIFEDDPLAKEGKRNAELAISNRLKYEKLKLFFARGIDLFNKKNFSEALLEFRQILVLDPGNNEAETYISRIEEIIDSQRSNERKRQQAEQFYQAALDDITGNRFNDARDNFENALSLVPKYKDIEVRIRNLKKLQDDYLEKLKKQKQADIEKEFENGLIYFTDQRYKEALASFERTLVLDPKNGLALGWLEKTKDVLREKQEEEVESTSPFYEIVSSLIVSGKDLYDKGLYAESRERWENIRSIFPNNKIAIEYILKCDLRLNPERFKTFAARVIEEGKAALEKNNYQKALARFQMIKSIDSTFPGIDALIASAQIQGKSRKRAVVAGQPQITDADIERRYQAGINFYKKGGEENLKLALEQFRWIAQNDPENIKSLIVMNKIESQLRTGADIVPERTGPKLTENQKRLVSEYYFKGINYYSNTNYEKAIEEWRKVLAIDPTHEKAKNNIRKVIQIMRK